MARHPAHLASISALLLSLAACAHVPTAADRQLAENYYDQGVLAVNERPQQALKLFRDSIEKNPELPEPHNALGLLYWWSFADPVNAKIEFEKALQLKPDFAEAANNLGTLLTDLKDYDGARKAYEKALAEPLYRTPYVAQTNLAWVLHLQGHDDQAEQLIRMALAAEPAYCVGHRQLARLFDAAGRRTEAAASWDRFVSLCPNDPEALLHGAMELVQKGDAAQAAQKLTKCIEEAGGKPVAKECRLALTQLPPLPAEAAPAPSAPVDEAGQSVSGARDLEEHR